MGRFSKIRRKPDQPPPDIGSLVTEEERDRRRYVGFGAVCGMLHQTFFGLYNFFSVGVVTESWLDALSVLLLAMTAGITLFSKLPHVGYRLGVFTLFFINVYTALFPGHEALSVLLGFYALPMLVFYILGLKEGSFWSASMLAILLALLLRPCVFSRATLVQWAIVDVLVSFLLVTAVAFILELVRNKTLNEYLASQNALTDAIRRQKAIGGLVPICSSCNKIRNDDGFWQNLESYLVEHTHAHISSGICDDCASKDASLVATESFVVPDELQSLYQWKDSEDLNKRKYIRMVVLTSVPVLWGYMISGFIQKNFMESIEQLVLGVGLIAVAILLKRVKDARPVYHFVVLNTFILFAMQYFTPSPNATDHLWLFLLPMTATFILGSRMGIIWSGIVLLFAAMVFTVPWFQHKYPHTTGTILFFSTTYMLLSFLCFAMELLRKRYFDRILQSIRELEKVYEGIQTLKGLVPVCQHCKSIRNDDGYWTRVDYYLYSHAQMTLSHGICPDCLQTQMPEIYAEMVSSGDME